MEECLHPVKVVRFKIDARGRYMYLYQCTTCHQRVGDWLKREVALNGRSATPFDSDAEQESRKRIYEERREERRVEWRSRYENHLRSDKWRELRRLVWQRAKGLCERCSEPGAHVHHLTYERMGDELLSDLQLLCRRCHEEEHPHMAESSVAAQAVSSWGNK